MPALNSNRGLGLSWADLVICRCYRCSVGRLQEASQTATFQYIPSEIRPNMTEELWPFASLNRICPGNCTSGYRATKQAVRAWRRDKNPPKSAASLLHDEVFVFSRILEILSALWLELAHNHIPICIASYCHIASYCIILRSMRQLPKSPPICLLWG